MLRRLWVNMQAISPADAMIMGGCMLNIATKVCMTSAVRSFLS